MKGKKYCGSISDIKMACPNCKEKYFFPIKSYDPKMLAAFKEYSSSFGVSCPWCYNGPGRTGHIKIDLDNPKEWYGDVDAIPEKKGLYDCVYFGEDYHIYARKFEEEIKLKFPTAILEDASDFIHGKRIAVTLDGAYRDDYITWMCLEGYAPSSLTIGLIIQDSSGLIASKHDRELIFAAVKILKDKKV